VNLPVHPSGRGKIGVGIMRRHFPSARARSSVTQGLSVRVDP
jgi:hypothetical protein